jgi:hypothetical protein
MAAFLEPMLGTSDVHALEEMTAKEMWIRFGNVAQESSFGLGLRQTEGIYLGVVAEGEDLRHVTHRIRSKGATAGQDRVAILTFKLDGSAWKIFPEERIPRFGGADEEGE